MSQKKTVVFVINPIAGTKSKNNLLDAINKTIDKDKFDYSVKFSREKGDATVIAGEAVKNSADVVVAVGGDGTVNEVAKALINTTTALGIVPSGSGDGLARHLHIPLDGRKAICLINEFKVKSLDYGVVNGNPFFCTCGTGFDAYISAKFAKADKRGPVTYIDEVLKDVSRYEPEEYSFEYDGKTFKTKAFVITCANASQYGNQAYIAPHATLSDGLMDVTIVSPFNFVEAPGMAFQLFNKNIDKNKKIKTFRCSKLRIQRGKPDFIHFDGEPFMTTPDIDVEIFHKGLKVVIYDEKYC